MGSRRALFKGVVGRGRRRTGILTLAVAIGGIGCSDDEARSPTSQSAAVAEVQAIVTTDPRPSVPLAAALPAAEEAVSAEDAGAPERAPADATGEGERPEPATERATRPATATPFPAAIDTIDALPATGPQSIYAGVYTAAQAARGSEIVQKECASCHAPGEWGRGELLRGFSGRTAYDLVAHIRNTMPMDGPGRLTHQEYTDIVAYLFQLNSVPAGPAELGADQTSQGSVRIEYKE
ncbi:MAG: cytochrome c [Gemmatimonadota bacterium]